MDINLNSQSSEQHPSTEQGCSIEQNLVKSKAVLLKAGSPSAALDAAVLLCHVLDKPRSYLLTWPERCLTLTQQTQFDALIYKRSTGEPVAYLVGMREFWSLPLEVSPTTLIPRPDTERLVELTLTQLIDHPIEGELLDLGTGTGAIALALASELPSRSVIGIERERAAFELATRNGLRLNINNVQFLHGSWFDPLPLNDDGCLARFAAIISNPPYIDPDDPHLLQGDVRFEPATALVAEEAGLADIKYIARHAKKHLLSHGWLLFEHGFEQGQAVRSELEQLGYHGVTTKKDYQGKDRVTLGYWP